LVTTSGRNEIEPAVLKQCRISKGKHGYLLSARQNLASKGRNEITENPASEILHGEMGAGVERIELVH
jgi:hypothetical protein